MVQELTARSGQSKSSGVCLARVCDYNWPDCKQSILGCGGPLLHLNRSALLSSLIFGWKLWVHLQGQWVTVILFH